MKSIICIALFALIAVVTVKAASLGNGLITVYTDSDGEVFRGSREAEPVNKGHLHHHHHHHHGSVGEEVYSKPSSCNKCGGGGGGGGPVATFAQSSAGTISGGNGGHGGHGGLGSQSVSQSAAYNFGPFSASFSASQSTGNGGFYGGSF